MIRLPKVKRAPKESEGLCKCRPVCKNRRREWKGRIHNTSAELLIERKPLAECIRRYPTKVYPNGPCPLFGRSRGVTIHERGVGRAHKVVRICEAPIDDNVDTTYLRHALTTKLIGAWDAVKACCAFCKCGHCCPCDGREYTIKEDEQARRDSMRAFDSRVRVDGQKMRIMYNDI